MQQTIDTLTRQLSERLLTHKQRICCAESCTGGMIAKTLTDLAGSSNWFERGFVTYSNEAKVEMLGVQHETLKVHGAVSEEVVREMAAGALRHSHADVAIAVTGIAGPGGGSISKPVGTVWFGFVIGEKVVAEEQHFDGDRGQVRLGSVRFALGRMLDLLDK